MKILLLADRIGTEMQVYKSSDKNLTCIEIRDEQHNIMYQLDEEDLLDLIEELKKLRNI